LTFLRRTIAADDPTVVDEETFDSSDDSSASVLDSSPNSQDGPSGESGPPLLSPVLTLDLSLRRLDALTDSLWMVRLRDSSSVSSPCPCFSPARASDGELPRPVLPARVSEPAERSSFSSRSMNEKYLSKVSVSSASGRHALATAMAIRVVTAVLSIQPLLKSSSAVTHASSNTGRVRSPSPPEFLVSD
jgi:hypothetical protein